MPQSSNNKKKHSSGDRWKTVGQQQQQEQKQKRNKHDPKFAAGVGPKDWGSQWRLTRRQGGGEQQHQHWIGMPWLEAEVFLRLTHAYGRHKVVFLTYSIWRKLLWMLPIRYFPSSSPKSLVDLKVRYPREELTDRPRQPGLDLACVLGHLGNLGDLSRLLPVALFQPCRQKRPKTAVEKKHQSPSPNSTAATAGGGGGGEQKRRQPISDGEEDKEEDTLYLELRRPLSQDLVDDVEAKDLQFVPINNQQRDRMNRKLILAAKEQEQQEQKRAERLRSFARSQERNEAAGEPKQKKKHSTVDEDWDRKLLRACGGDVDEYEARKARGWYDICYDDDDYYYDYYDEYEEYAPKVEPVWRFLEASIEGGHLLSLRVLLQDLGVVPQASEWSQRHHYQRTDSETLLHKAARTGKFEICHFLLEKSGIRVDLDSVHWCPMLEDNASILEAAIQGIHCYLDPTSASSISSSTSANATSLEISSSSLTDLLRLLLTHGASVEEAEKRTSLIFLLVEEGLKEKEYGVINAKNKTKKRKQQSGQNSSTKKAMRDTIEVLSAHGADINSVEGHWGKSWTPLHAAEGHPELESFLRELGARK